MSFSCRFAHKSLGCGSRLQSSRLRLSLSSTKAAKIASSARPSLSFNTKCMSTTAATGGSLLTQLATDNPYKDVVRYEHKNRKWNLQHVDFYSEALAIGLLESGLQPGDVVLSWLSPHFSESVSEIFFVLAVHLIWQNLLTIQL